MKRIDDYQAFEDFGRAQHQRLEVSPASYSLRYTIHEGQTINHIWMQHCLSIPTVFLLENIKIYGLASDALTGFFKLSHAGIGRTYIDCPLWYYALRSKRPVKPAIFFGVGSCMTVELYFEGITTGLDLLGKSRDKRMIEVLLLGKKGLIIQ